ncbi:MAG: VWA domain-containing protein [Bacillota bacterium]|nr:VWA domain-containing protein [Bacillota bacterium]
MVFNFNYPLFLLLIPAAAVFVIMTARKLRLARWRKNTAIALRISVFILLALCIAGLGIKKVSSSTSTLFLYDGSDSTSKSANQMEDFIKNAIKHRNNSDKVGIINFGGNSSIEMTPTAKPQFSSIQTKVNANFTNMEQALQTSSAIIPAGDRKRIVLISDGAENTGDALKEIKQLKHRNFTVDIFPVKTASGNEVQLKGVVLPENLHLKEKFEIGVNIKSTVKTGATLKLYTDRQLVSEKRVEIQAGENNFAFSDTAQKGGLVTYTAVIEPDTDTIMKNNTASAFSYIEDIPQILVVQDEDKAASELVKMLGNDVRIKTLNPEAVPKTADELQKYDAFIISNVSADKLDDRFLTSLETCIKYQGKGLLVTGGENSYAPGGYYKTELEKVLPVNMDIKPKQELPNLGLVLVIDKSGSMSEGQYGVSKVELAKEAAIRATEVLRPDDMIGVIGFDSALQWVVKLQKPNDLKAIQDSIGTIRADGGTQIIPPLQEAYLALKNSNTKLKHIILLTDGQAEKGGYDQLMDDINKAGITLSTVAVGREADAELLQNLSIGGGGRFYKTDVFSDIPKIFAKETFLAGKTYLNNRTFTPTLTSYSDILKGITAVPSLDGYVGTTAKSTASVIFTSDRDDPVLAAWQYGLGRTVAWTPDVKGMWTSSWLGWNQGPQFWKNLVSWIIQKRNNDEYTIKGGISNGTGYVELNLPPEGRNSDEKIQSIMISPSGKEVKTELTPTSPGVYRGSFGSDETGVYLADISIFKGDVPVKNISTGISIPYSPEYDIPSRDPGLFLEKLAYESGGRIIKNPGEVFTGDVAPVISITDIVPFLTALVIILLLLDITVRRINIPIEKAGLVCHKAAAAGNKAVSVIIRPVSGVIAKARAPVEKHIQFADKTEPGVENTVKTKKEPKPSIPTEQNNQHISTLLEKKKRRER